VKNSLLVGSCAAALSVIGMSFYHVAHEKRFQIPINPSPSQHKQTEYSVSSVSPLSQRRKPFPVDNQACREEVQDIPQQPATLEEIASLLFAKDHMVEVTTKIAEIVQRLDEAPWEPRQAYSPRGFCFTFPTKTIKFDDGDVHYLPVAEKESAQHYISLVSREGFKSPHDDISYAVLQVNIRTRQFYDAEVEISPFFVCKNAEGGCPSEPISRKAYGLKVTNDGAGGSAVRIEEERGKEEKFYGGGNEIIPTAHEQMEILRNIWRIEQNLHRWKGQ
jgi:hypothetical protein